MDLNELRPFARRAYGRLVAAFPELAPHARATGPDTARREGDLVVSIPSVNARVPATFLIDTDNDEVSYFWDAWHTHASLWVQPGEDDLDAAVRVLSDIFAERIAMAEYPGGGSTDDPEVLLEELEESRAMLARGDRGRVWSWLGTYDRTVEGDADRA